MKIWFGTGTKRSKWKWTYMVLGFDKGCKKKNRNGEKKKRGGKFI